VEHPSGIDGQNWDESVKAIAYYPNILNMMADNIEWTADLGDAFSPSGRRNTFNPAVSGGMREMLQSHEHKSADGNR